MAYSKNNLILLSIYLGAIFCAVSLFSGCSGVALNSQNSPEAKAAIKVKKALCTELENESKYALWTNRYDNRTQKCYKTGQAGPCGKNMIFYSLPNDQVYGECDCNYDIECKSLIYSHVYDQCFYAYDQGHCEDGYWLVADASGLPSCERNLCRPPPKYSLKYQWALYKGRCERLYKPLHDCRPEEYLWIPKGNRFPQCGKVECNNPHSFVPELQCELGRTTVTKNCLFGMAVAWHGVSCLVLLSPYPYIF